LFWKWVKCVTLFLNASNFQKIYKIEELQIKRLCNYLKPKLKNFPVGCGRGVKTVSRTVTIKKEIRKSKYSFDDESIWNWGRLQSVRVFSISSINRDKCFTIEWARRCRIAMNLINKNYTQWQKLCNTTTLIIVVLCPTLNGITLS
jgi:hypothetical protein